MDKNAIHAYVKDAEVIGKIVVGDYINLNISKPTFDKFSVPSSRGIVVSVITIPNVHTHRGLSERLTAEGHRD